MNEALMRTAEARDFLKVSRAMFCRLQKRAGFPRPVRLGARCLRWRESELLAFAKASQHPSENAAARATGPEVA